MTGPKQTSPVRTEVVRDPTVMSGEPVVQGTRILADTILSYLRADCPAEQIFRDYPSLPVDGIDAVARWAHATYGPDWKSANATAPLQPCSKSPDEDSFAREFKHGRSKVDPNLKLGF
jgi:uncharacterized protein (DUF433 family)